VIAERRGRKRSREPSGHVDDPQSFQCAWHADPFRIAGPGWSMMPGQAPPPHHRAIQKVHPQHSPKRELEERRSAVMIRVQSSELNRRVPGPSASR
jgi:hypothetical protein